ncbi:BLUF domain-containing protein [Acinetobacter courvalinii]|uniref:BLUF domain-containing protein n=1 Tax=Acinetobacter courvalinii TaxID=280147 RepID=UPI001902978C|nr:BLUF domain-containing protein [Acinetobacter courvalinii]MBJ9955614.1 BLUF domain-containing protein [Acinetobacter courvalinii]
MNIRLCYASKRNENSDDLLQDLRDILTEARDFNTQHCIYGVLYYADNAFFQCLEGEQAIVESLFEKIKTDARHLEVKHFGTDPIDQYTFKRWSMKYVQRNTNIETFLLNLGENSFNPSCLEPNSLNAFLEELLLAEQTTLPVAKKVGMVNRGVNPF